MSIDVMIGRHTLENACLLALSLAFLSAAHAGLAFTGEAVETRGQQGLGEAPAAQHLLMTVADTTQVTAAARTFDIVVKDGRLISKQRVLVVRRNDEVVLHVTSDAVDQFHLHGYNLLVDLAPGKTAILKFKATLTGRFTYELHKTDLELGALEVYP